MANFAPSSSSSSSLLPLSFAGNSMAIAFPRGDDDLEEDCCSICLEFFGSNDPATITNCKHEYHLHCILEWSQRSKECPICWQTLSLSDPSSQELLAAVGKERCSRSRNTVSVVSPNIHYYQEDGDTENESSDEFIVDERIMQHLAAAASRARLRGRERHRYSGLFRSEELFHGSPANLDQQEHETQSDECRDSSPEPFFSGSLPAFNAEPSLPVVPTTAIDSGVAFKPRVLYSQSPSVRPQRSNPSSDILNFSDSIKSKWSAASAKYKESISKGTKGLKEKLLARNNSVKEISKGVHREVSAGVARMMERFEKKPVVSPSEANPTSLSTKGKGVLDAIIAQSLSKNGGKIHGVGSDASLQPQSITIPGRVEVSRPQTEQ